MTVFKVSNLGSDFQDVSEGTFSFINVAKRKRGAREAKPVSAKNDSLSAIMMRYEQLRNEVLTRMIARDTDLFWIQWMEDIMPISPNAPEMWVLLYKSHLISHADTEIQVRIESIVIDYFNICTSIDIRSFLKLQNSTSPDSDPMNYSPIFGQFSGCAKLLAAQAMSGY